MIFISFVVLYLAIGVILGFISQRIDPEDKMSAKEWFWIVVAWLSGLVCVGLEYLVSYLKNRRKK